MAKKAAPKPAQKAQPEPETTGVSKSQAAREAIAAGLESPGEAVEFIKKKFGIDMKPEHFSAVKAQEKKKSGVPPLKRGPRPKAASEPRVKGVPADGDIIDDLAAVKHLVEKLGGEQVRKIVGLFE